MPLFPLPPFPVSGLHAFIQVQYQFLCWMRMRMFFWQCSLLLAHIFRYLFRLVCETRDCAHTEKEKEEKNVLLRKPFFYPEEGGVPDLSTEAYKLQKFAETSADDRALVSAQPGQSSPVPEIHDLWTSTFSDFWDVKLPFSARSTSNESKMSQFGAVFSSAQNGMVKAYSIILDMQMIDVLPCLCSRLPDLPQICPILERLVCITSFMGNIHGYR